jgi:hypothetical protein
MKHWRRDRSTMQGSRFRRDPSVFRGLTWETLQDLSRDQREMTAVGCIWLRSVTSLQRQIDWHKPRSETHFPRSKRRAWDSNPR